MGGISQKLVTFSAETGTLLRTLNHILARGGYQQVLWASPSAQLLIVSGTQPGPTVGSFNLGHSAGILSDDRFTPIPWSNRTFAAVWQYLPRGCRPAQAPIRAASSPDLACRLRFVTGYQPACSAERTSFDFLGFTFRLWQARRKDGAQFTAFLPAISKDALKISSGEVRSWRLNRHVEMTPADIACWNNPKVRGWMTAAAAMHCQPPTVNGRYLLSVLVDGPAEDLGQGGRRSNRQWRR